MAAAAASRSNLTTPAPGQNVKAKEDVKVLFSLFQPPLSLMSAPTLETVFFSPLFPRPEGRSCVRRSRGANLLQVRGKVKRGFQRTIV